MKGSLLKEDFYSGPALRVARELLGKVLVRRIGRREIRGIISETEAYIGPQDLGAHSSKGRTPRTEVMFGPPGRWYVYFNYGMHWMLNVVTGKTGHPAAVLFRGLNIVSGPGRLTKILKIDKSLNAKTAVPENGLWIEDAGIKIPRGVIKRAARIGIDYAGPVWAPKPYRFFIPKEYLTHLSSPGKFRPTMARMALKIEKKSKKLSGGG